jgi:hypothetical protein
MMKTLGRVFAIAMCFVRIIAPAMAQTVAASSGTSQAIPREINTLDAARPVTAGHRSSTDCYATFDGY